LPVLGGSEAATDLLALLLPSTSSTEVRRF
jgi:hypothetical protein